jgi:hypothetical protein
MSNLSDIGFPVKSEQDVNQVIMDILPHLEQISCPPYGFYFRFADVSGAEIYIQTNPAQEIVGFNPAFAGRTRFKGGLIARIERDTSELDGAFHAWADPQNDDFEKSGAFPFVFDVPDFRTHEKTELPKLCDVQLTAFASNDFQLFADTEEFDASQESELKYASKSFIPSGLFAFNEQAESVDTIPPQAHAILTGEIREFELKTNEFTGANFYWFRTETHGGEIDLVADANLIETEPQTGGIVRGSFWLSGKLVQNS